MCYEAHLVSEVVRDTWLEAESPLVGIVINMAVVNHCVRETTVNEESEVTSLSELVTNVRIDSESVAVEISIIAQNFVEVLASLIIIAISICVRNTNSQSDVKLVVEGVTNLRKEIESSSSTILCTIFRSLSCVETYFTADPDLCICCERCNSYESCKN